MEDEKIIPTIVPRKSLREQLDELAAKVDKMSPEEEKKEKKKLPISSMSIIIGLIAGGFIFSMTWLLSKSVYWGIGLGVITTGIVFTASKFIESNREWKLPLTKRTLGRKKKRQGYVIFMNIGLNKAVTFIKAPIVEGVAELDGIPHVISPDDILLWKNKIPIVIQPQFSEKPYSITHHYDMVKKDNEGTEGWRFILNYLMKSQITDKKSIPLAPIIIGALILLGLGYYAVKSGVFK